MATVNTIVLVPTTSAAASDEFYIGPYECVTVGCYDLTGAEAGTVQSKNPLDNTWHDYYQNGVLVQFTSITNSVDLWNSAGTFRINKTATVSAVGVTVSRYLD